MGLHPSNAFACAVDFLFRVRPEALEPHLPVGFWGTAAPWQSRTLHPQFHQRSRLPAQHPPRGDGAHLPVGFWGTVGACSPISQFHGSAAPTAWFAPSRVRRSPAWR